MCTRFGEFDLFKMKSIEKSRKKILSNRENNELVSFDITSL